MNCPHLIQQNWAKTTQGKYIYKDQCSKCFSDTFNEDGINVCLVCFNGGCIKPFNHSYEHLKFFQHPLIVNIKQKVKEKINDKDIIQEETKLTKIAIGKEGGAPAEQLQLDEYETLHSIYCLYCNMIIPEEQLPNSLKDFVQNLLNTQAAQSSQQLTSWELEIFPCEHTLTLQQDQNKIIQIFQISKCIDCNISNALWFCLTCGNVGCARKQPEGYVGGNGHGKAHYEKTKHPLAVKLGTIQPDGLASIYCYQCNDDIKDEFLASHLSNFGIDITSLIKTEKTIMELNLDLNLNLVLSKVMEEGKKIDAVFGPGFTGLQNLGNTCYINSVLQVLFSIPEILQKYYINGKDHLKNCNKFPPECFTCQLCKIGFGLQSGSYSIKKEETIKELKGDGSDEFIEKIIQYQDGIKIPHFKVLVSKGHIEFMSNRQQDAYEYFLHLFNYMEKSEKQNNFGNTSKLFKFEIGYKLVCMGCQGYKFKEEEAGEIKLIPPYQQLVKDEDEYTVSFEQLLKEFNQSGLVEGLYCPNCKKNQNFLKTTYFKSFPKYLIVLIAREHISQQYNLQKIQAYIQTPDIVSLKYLQKPEILLNEFKLQDENQIEPLEITYNLNQENLLQLIQMGFGENRAKRGLIEKNNNLEEAMLWLTTQIDNQELDLPIQQQILQQNKQLNSEQFDNQTIEMVTQMGFTQKQAVYALKITEGSVERAIDFLFNHPEIEDQTQKQQQKFDEDFGPTNIYNYKLHGAVVHLGKNIHCGHYVAYARKNDEWIFYNDRKVAKTIDPLIGKAYFLIFQQLKY